MHIAQMKRNQIKYIAAAGILLLTGLLSRTEKTLAYLTDSEKHTNTLTYGNVKIDLIETNWNPSDAHLMVPDRVRAKNPNAINTGEEDEWVVLQIKIPYIENAITASTDTETLNPAADTDLYTLETIDSTKWEAIGTVQKDTTEKISYHIYGFKTPLQAGESTGELFTNIKMSNFIDGTVFTDTDIGVVAYGVQTDGVATVADAWNLVKNQDAGKTINDADTSGAKNLSGADRS